MARVIAICNQKGGVGKTTTAMNLSGYLGMLGKKTLLIDLDPQFNSTIGLGITHHSNETIYHALMAGEPIERVIKNTRLANLDMAPASSDLSGALVELIEVQNREWKLRNLIEPIRHLYDFILIDLGPSVNLLTINGLVAADEVIIPVQCEYYSLEGLGQLLETIDLIKNNLGHSIVIGGALLTMYDKREKLSREVAREIRRRFPYNVYDIEIPRSVALAEAPSYKKPIMLFAPQSPGATAYEQLAREICGERIKHIEKNEIQTPVQQIVESFSAQREEEKETEIERGEAIENTPVVEVIEPYTLADGEEKPLILIIHEENN